MAAGNFVSLFGAAYANGVNLIENPSRFYKDANPDNIIYVTYNNLNWNGQVLQGFMIRYQEPKKESLSKYFLPDRTGLMTMSDFQAGLTSLNAYDNTFTIYTGLVKTSDLPASYFFNKAAIYLTVLCNDKYCFRNYLASLFQTVVQINVFNKLSSLNMWFAGDQNYGGNYYYFTNTGNH